MENKMLTQDVVREVSDRLQCYNKDARDVIDCFVAVVGDHVLHGETVHISKMGTFYPCRSRSFVTWEVGDWLLLPGNKYPINSNLQ